jgi:hypothetical protein
MPVYTLNLHCDNALIYHVYFFACREKEKCGHTGWWEKTLHVDWLESEGKQSAH